MLSTVLLVISYAISVTFIHSFNDLHCQFAWLCHYLQPYANNGAFFALLAYVALVFTFCGLNSGQERVHPSLLIAMWIQNHRCGSSDAVRMAERSKALRSGRSLPWRRGFESHFWQPVFFTVVLKVAAKTILGKTLDDERLRKKPQRFSLYTFNLCTESNVLVYSSCAATMCSINL